MQYVKCGVMYRGFTDCPELYKICESWLLLVPRGPSQTTLQSFAGSSIDYWVIWKQHFEGFHPGDHLLCEHVDWHVMNGLSYIAAKSNYIFRRLVVVVTDI